MPIKTEYGKVSTIAQFGKLAGESIQAQREQAIKADLLKQALAFQQQEKIIQFQADLEIETQMMAMKWEQQKMMFRSQQTFEMEQMKERAYIEQELAKELKQQTELDMAKNRINRDDSLTQTQKSQALAKIDLKYLGYQGTLGAQRDDPFEQLMTQMLQGTQQQNISVVSPDGTTGTIPAEDWPEAEREGYKRQ